MTPILEVTGLHKRFPRMDHAVLEEIDLTIRPGGFTSLIGPSGCGKTTLLRIVGGLETADSGEIRIDGHLSMGPSREKAIVFQHFNLFPWRTALSNVAYGLELQGVPRKTRMAKAKEYLDLVGLADFADHYPSQLSGGMQQRVGIARALVMEPKLLLMDEPFGALDALTREYLQAELERLCEKTEASVLFVTHSIDEAIYLSDDVLVMGSRPGRILDRVSIDLRRPRRNYDIRGEPEFAKLRARLWDDLDGSFATGNRQRMIE